MLSLILAVALAQEQPQLKTGDRHPLYQITYVSQRDLDQNIQHLRAMMGSPRLTRDSRLDAAAKDSLEDTLVCGTAHQLAEQSIRKYAGDEFPNWGEGFVGGDLSQFCDFMYQAWRTGGNAHQQDFANRRQWTHYGFAIDPNGKGCTIIYGRRK
jgi:hypothetical protein